MVCARWIDYLAMWSMCWSEEYETGRDRIKRHENMCGVYIFVLYFLFSFSLFLCMKWTRERNKKKQTANKKIQFHLIFNLFIFCLAFIPFNSVNNKTKRGREKEDILAKSAREMFDNFYFVFFLFEYLEFNFVLRNLLVFCSSVCRSAFVHVFIMSLKKKNKKKKKTISKLTSKWICNHCAYESKFTAQWIWEQQKGIKKVENKFLSFIQSLTHSIFCFVFVFLLIFIYFYCLFLLEFFLVYYIFFFHCFRFACGYVHISFSVFG